MYTATPSRLLETNPLQDRHNLFNEAEVISDDPAESGETENDTQNKDETGVSVAAHTRKKKQNTLSLPEDLPRVRVEHDLSDDEKACDHCGEHMLPVGEDTSEQLCSIPATVLCGSPRAIEIHLQL